MATPARATHADAQIGDPRSPCRSAKAGIPQEVKFQKNRELALEMIDQVRGWNLADPIVVADAGYGDVTAFREGLESLKLHYAVGVQSKGRMEGTVPATQIETETEGASSEWPAL